jgi:hypothetical protein
MERSLIKQKNNFFSLLQDAQLRALKEVNKFHIASDFSIVLSAPDW